MRTREEIQRARSAILRARDLIKQQIAFGHKDAHAAQVAALEAMADFAAWYEADGSAAAQSVDVLIDHVMGPGRI